MALVTQTVKTDDFNGGPAHHTRTFTWEGKTYQTDLDNLNAGNFDRAMQRVKETMERYVSVATEVVSEPKTRKSSGSKSSTPSQASVIRSWAREQGMTVGTRGRLHPDLVAAYQAAHQA